jgi:hypothetical protein
MAPGHERLFNSFAAGANLLDAATVGIIGVLAPRHVHDNGIGGRSGNVETLHGFAVWQTDNHRPSFNVLKFIDADADGAGNAPERLRDEYDKRQSLLH